jgi:AP-3 complex subunit sigma
MFTQVTTRPDSFCNYLEGVVPEWGENVKLIYRHYATLFFIFAVDAQESDLGILDLIQVFVEALDKCFENVCELDLIFHSDRVHYVLDEIVMGGMVLETNISIILQSIKE